MTKFVVIKRKEESTVSNDTFSLEIDYWNDYSYVTQFYLRLHDQNGSIKNIGYIKIGFKGQDQNIQTYTKLNKTFEKLSNEYFSLGGDIEYYKNLHSLSEDLRQTILVSLNDIVYNQSIIDKILDEDVFKTSLLRETSLSIIKGQYTRVLNGQAELTDFKFSFIRIKNNAQSNIKLDFNVLAESTPTTNIHALIGRNGVGKTTILNNMIDAITKKSNEDGCFYEEVLFSEAFSPIPSDYFSSLVSSSFSAFDSFIPPTEQADPTKGTCYFYIGLKNPTKPLNSLSINELQKQCSDAIIDCFSNQKKKDRWLKAIEELGSDENFLHINLENLYEIYTLLRSDYKSEKSNIKKDFFNKIKDILQKLSSGHAVVLFTISRLVAVVEEKTLVLLDEPESHLHPPLLSAFIRALGNLLYEMNGVAIIATHSPVVLQEIPRSCVWKINRVGKYCSIKRPDIETFGENVGILTREVFGLEVAKSGFHALLEKSVNSGKTYSQILDEYNDQLGIEGRSILKALVIERDNKVSST